MSINEVQNQIIEEFSIHTELMDKYKAILLSGKNLEPLEDKYKTDNYAIRGCASTVWIVTEINDNKINFRAQSETMVTQGILSLILKVLNNQTPDDIYNADLYFIERIGLKNQLSPSRVNGLSGILHHIREEAKKLMSS